MSEIVWGNATCGVCHVPLGSTQEWLEHMRVTHDDAGLTHPILKEGE